VRDFGLRRGGTIARLSSVLQSTEIRHGPLFPEPLGNNGGVLVVNIRRISKVLECRKTEVGILHDLSPARNLQ
jgi:hypothetical protein